MSEPLWTPSPQRIEAANMTAFMRFVEQRHCVSLNAYEPLWQWSVDHRQQFWAALWDFCNIRASRRWDEVFVEGDKMPGARWFTGSRLNFAENILCRTDDEPAILFWNEQGRQQPMSFSELRREVARIAQWLRTIGVESGDRIAAFAPNIPQTVVTMLAAASIGAIFSSCSPDFGVEAVVERFAQIEPVVLLTADGATYGGKSFDSLAKVREFLPLLPSIKQTLVVPYVDENPSLDGLVSPTDWNAIESADGELSFEQLPFDHPLVILFSSGTTGVPKCIVHSAGGTLLQHRKEHLLHTNLGPHDRLFYFTTCGWMMWNWLVSALAGGTSIVLYDGSPFHPSGNVFFDMIDAQQITAIGLSASYIAALENADLQPAHTHRLETLRTILSTGSPLLPEGFDYVYRSVKEDVCLSSISGGTDIVSCFALGNPIGPVWRGELQCRGLGMHVEVFDEEGHSVIGSKGELVCVKAFPSMPIGFWNDPDEKKYRAAYFDRFANVWHHGDFAERTENGGLVIHGRSDAVLNPGGVRIGTAEIYRQANSLSEVVDSIAIGQQWQDDVRVVLFVRLVEGQTLDEELAMRIRQTIRSGASPRHVPAKILQVPDIPRTRSGKIVELAVREAVHGRPINNRQSLANPAALEFFRNRPELTS